MPRKLPVPEVSTSVVPVAPKAGRVPKRGHRFDALEIRMGLEAVAICAGSYTRASRMLMAQRGLDIQDHTLRAWCLGKHAELYATVQFEAREQIDRLAIAEARSLVTELADLERAAIEATYKQLADGTVKDASGVLRNASTSKAINLDKIALHEGRPTSIVESRSGEETLRALAAMGRVAVVEGSAEDAE